MRKGQSESSHSLRPWRGAGSLEGTLEGALGAYHKVVRLFHATPASCRLCTGPAHGLRCLWECDSGFGSLSRLLTRHKRSPCQQELTRPCAPAPAPAAAPAGPGDPPTCAGTPSALLCCAHRAAAPALRRRQGGGSACAAPDPMPVLTTEGAQLRAASALSAGASGMLQRLRALRLWGMAPWNPTSLAKAGHDWSVKSANPTPQSAQTLSAMEPV